MKKILLTLAFGVLLSACGSSDSGSGSTAGAASGTAAAPQTAAPAKTEAPAATPAKTAAAAAPGAHGIAGPATLDGAKAVVAGLQGAADAKAEFAKLRPGADEIKEMFSDAAAADAVTKHVDEMFGKLDQEKLEFKKGEADVYCVPSDDVIKWTPDVEKKFPGGYKRLGSKLKGGVTMCKFKIGGVAFDSLVNVKGNWYYVGKPFRAIRE